MLAALRYFWRTNLAVLLAAAVASSVLTGALLVGDSVRGSLRDLTLERLGRIDEALLGESFFRQELAAELAADAELGEGPVAPAILLQGAVIHAESRARVARANIQGIGAAFGDLFPAQAGELVLERSAGQSFPSAVINARLARELGAEPGDQVVLSLERPSDVPRESLLGSTDPTDVLQSLRVEVVRVLEDRGVGRFGLAPHQSLPANVFVDLQELQGSLDLGGRVNAILVGGRLGAEGPDLETLARRHLSLADLGLELEEREQILDVGSREILLRPRLAEALEEVTAELGVEVLRLSTYLANATRLSAERSGAPRQSVPYSTITALETPVPERFGSLTLEGGEPVPALGEEEILVNAWMARELDARPGDGVVVTYYEVGPRETLVEKSVELEISGIVAMQGLGIDERLTPEFPGVHDAEDMSDWEPTFPVDLSRITDRDEEYWDEHGSAPKAFVDESLGRRLWGSRFGELSGVLLAPPPGMETAELAEDLKAELLPRLTLGEVGLAIAPLKASGLEASNGATDFGGLFIGFSLFLIVSAGLLVALFFRLGVEQRASEIGLLLALGYPPRSVRRRFLREGGVLAGIGSVVGLGGAVLYAGAMMAGLRSWWQGAVGSTFLYLHVEPLSLTLGLLLSLGLVLFAIWRAVRRLEAQPAVGLLRGRLHSEAAARGSRRARRVLWGSLGLGLLLLLATTLVGEAELVYLFFGVGAVLLVACLAAFAVWLGRPHRTIASAPGSGALVRMAAANATLNPGRSLLSVALVGSACFVIVAVGANGLRFGDEVRRLESGAGGYALVAESDVPIHHDLNDAGARLELGFNDRSSEALDAARVVPFRVVPGDDVSCLNLYQPKTPRLLGVPPEQIERGGFPFQMLIRETEDPWGLLEEDLGPDTIPAFGDFNSVAWILKSWLGRDVEMENDHGETVKLRLVGLMRRSLFQSELLISEEKLLEHFPSRSGFGYFLIDVPPEDEERATEALESELGNYGLDVTSTAQRLQSYQAVENTYLSTFQTLGGLGLLLGTVGLAVILLRNILERRAELATLRALGFRRARLAWMVVAENGLLLSAGVVTGTVAALVAVMPHLLHANALVPWATLLATLLLVLAVGTLACIAAVRQALRAPLLPALRSE